MDPYIILDVGVGMSLGRRSEMVWGAGRLVEKIESPAWAIQLTNRFTQEMPSSNGITELPTDAGTTRTIGRTVLATQSRWIDSSIRNPTSSNKVMYFRDGNIFDNQLLIHGGSRAHARLFTHPPREDSTRDAKKEARLGMPKPAGPYKLEYPNP